MIINCTQKYLHACHKTQTGRRWYQIFTCGYRHKLIRCTGDGAPLLRVHFWTLPWYSLLLSYTATALTKSHDISLSSALASGPYNVAFFLVREPSFVKSTDLNREDFFSKARLESCNKFHLFFQSYSTIPNVNILTRTDLANYMAFFFLNLLKYYWIYSINHR